MEYPESPFRSDFNDDIIIPSECNIENRDAYLAKLKKWLCETPKITSFRSHDIKENIEAQLRELYSERHIQIPKVYEHPSIKDTVILEHLNPLDLNLSPVEKEVIVDTVCAAAILRGAHIFAPGVVGMTKDCKLNDTVSVYTDVHFQSKCNMGYAEVWQSPGKVFIANGLVRMTRGALFSERIPSGIAIEITDVISGCPAIDTERIIAAGGLLQNIPSIVAVQCLDPSENENILDMCASPGGKTTHISQIIGKYGIVVAVDKTPAKVAALKRTCALLHCPKNVIYVVADSTTLLTLPNSEIRRRYDRILLDAPCSGTGRRPQLLNKDTETVLRSYIPLQRKLIKTAYELLQPNGILVYCTCSITMPENEGIVAYALKNFALELLPSEPKIGGDALPFEGISHPEYLQRFGPDDGVNSIGFFIAKFRKCARK